MTWNAITVWMEHVASVAVTGGFVTALSLVCLLQYAVHLYQQRRHVRERNEMRRRLDGLEAELSVVVSDRAQADIENRILRDFVGERDIDAALTRLLATFVPDGSHGFAAFVLVGKECEVRQAVGLSNASRSAFTIDSDLLEQLQSTSMVTIDHHRLKTTRLYESLAETDRKHLEQLHLVRAATVGSIVDAVLATTYLYPPDATTERQRELVERVLSGVSNHVRVKTAQEAQEQELRVTREILELRSIVDLEFRSPTEMLQEFLDHLVKVTGFHQAGLYLQQGSSHGLDLQLLIRHSSPLTRDAAAQWDTGEAYLAQCALNDPEVKCRGTELLKRMFDGVDIPFGEAVTAPMTHRTTRVGTLCLTRVSPARVTQADVELIEWAAEYLLETILRTADRAVIEEQARRDALTGLANRHAFDAAIVEHVQYALRTGRECSLVLFDIDRFKSINDRYGHLAGDEALRRVASVAREEVESRLRDGDHPLVARYGGEEIALILPSIGLGGALRIAHAIRERVEAISVTHDGVTFQLTVSGGVATAPMHARTVRQLITAADGALYHAKGNGRNRIEAPGSLATAAIHS